jgi:hypothetical protein
MSDSNAGWLVMALTLGPSPVVAFTDGQLRRAWSVYRDEVMGGRRSPGTRPFGFWAYEVGEDPPGDDPAEALRLLELGRLDADEIAAVRERAEEWIEFAGRDDTAVTSPRDAVEHMRAQSRADAEAWGRVLAAIDAAAGDLVGR